MKKLLIAFSLLSIFLISSCKVEVIGSDTLVSEERNLSSFQDIDVSGVLDVNIKHGTTQKIEVIANDNVIDRVLTSISNNTLNIDLDNVTYDNISITVNITIPEFNSVSTQAVGKIDIDGFEILENLTITNSGVGEINASGFANNLTLNLSGAGDIKGFGFTGANTTVSLSGVGSIQISCTDSLNGTLSGVGNIFYKGSPTLGISTTGVGSVIDAN